MDPQILALIQQLLAGMGGDYGYGADSGILGLTLPSVGGLNVDDANDYLTMVGKQQNLQSDAFKQALDPLMRVLLGTYLPQQEEVASVPTPTLDAWAAGAEGPVFQQIAEGMKSGQITAEGARKLLEQAQADESSPSYQALQTYTPDQIVAVVNGAWKEHTDSLNVKAQNDANDPFKKLGLPSPLERYTDDADGDGMPDNVPMDSAVAAGFTNDIQARQDVLDRAQALADSWRSDYLDHGTNPAGGTLAGAPLHYGDGANDSPGDAAGLDGAGPHYKKSKVTAYFSPYIGGKTRADLIKEGKLPEFPGNPFLDQLNLAKSQLAIASGRESAYRRYKAEQLDSQGRTPLKDNLEQTLLKVLLSRGF